MVVPLEVGLLLPAITDKTTYLRHIQAAAVVELAP